MWHRRFGADAASWWRSSRSRLGVGGDLRAVRAVRCSRTPNGRMVETVVAAGVEGRVHCRAGLRRDPMGTRENSTVARAVEVDTNPKRKRGRHSPPRLRFGLVSFRHSSSACQSKPPHPRPLSPQSRGEGRQARRPLYGSARVFATAAFAAGFLFVVGRPAGLLLGRDRAIIRRLTRCGFVVGGLVRFQCVVN